MQQKEAAAGLLDYAKKKHEGEIRVQERWHEKLHDWDKALKAYREKESESQQPTQDSELVLGQMRCLEALCEWGELHTLAETHWKQVIEFSILFGILINFKVLFQVSADLKNRFARMAAAASWGLGEWSSMEDYVNFIPKETQDGAFFRSVLAIHKYAFI